MMTFNAIDVETANQCPGSICQIGICSVKNGVICSQWETLVNPETNFNSINVKVHSIQETDVRHAPALSEVYGELCERVHGSILVHHPHFEFHPAIPVQDDC